MKDSNEYGRNVKAKSKTDKTLRLGKVTLIFGAGGSLTDENIDTFLHDVKAIDVLTVKGLMPDIMENVKYIKEKMETQAKQEFGTAQAALNVETEHLERLKERRREYEEQSAGLLKGKLDLRAIEENKEALLKMDSIVATQAIRVEKAKENVEAARERMAEAMKERKMHETLREKAFEAFLQEENHAESKAIDELTSYTYGQKNR